MACCQADGKVSRQASVWTNDGLGWWRIYASLSLNKLIFVKFDYQSQIDVVESMLKTRCIYSYIHT